MMILDRRMRVNITLAAVLIIPLIGCGADKNNPMPSEKNESESKIPAFDRKKLFAVWDNIWKRELKEGYETLSSAEQTFYTAWHIESEVNHGGFEYYYFNSGGDHALEAPGALKRVGAEKFAKIVEEANKRFPGGPPSPDCDERQNAMDPLGDKVYTLWSDLDDKVIEGPEPTEELLWVYYQKNKGEFRK
jgi:hypothetical protein